MPYRLRKAPKRDLYWVIDDTGKHYSKDPLPKERAKAQQKALYASERRQLKGGTELETHLQKKRPTETEDEYQRRLLRTQQQTERLAKAGITPEGRKTAIQASAKVRQLKQMRDVLGAEATAQAYERDPRTIAKRAEIARKEQENAIFNPILSGLVDVAKVGSELPFLPQPLREIGSMTADYLGATMADEEAMKQQRLAEREAKMASVADYNADLARQREEAMKMGSLSDIDRQIAEQQRLARGSGKMPRFGDARYF